MQLWPTSGTHVRRQQQPTRYCFKTALGSTGEIQQHIPRSTREAEAGAHLHGTAGLPAENSWTSQAVGTDSGDCVTSGVPQPNNSSSFTAPSCQRSPFTAERSSSGPTHGNEKSPSTTKMNPDAGLHRSANGRLSQPRSSVKTEASKINERP